MSQENVEALRRAFEASASEGYDLSPFFALYSPDVELYVSPSAAESGVWRGFDAVTKWWLDIVATWDRVSWEPREFIDIGDGVLDVVDLYAWNRQSDVALRQQVAHVFRFSEDEIVRVEYYFAGKQEALEAAGLSE